MTPVGFGARDLLVASAGGHLTQLHLLAQRLVPARPRTWVTYDHPQAHSLLAGEHVVHGYGPSSRSATRAARNWRLARRLLDTGEYDRVVSTGAAIAVPFLLRAERLGIEAHYVESATRSLGPSLSGRILQRLTRSVGLHTQHAHWSDARWHATSSVFDGFVARPTEAPGAALRVVVSMGTHHFAFDRLLDGLAGALRDGDEVVVQHGTTPIRPLPGRVAAHDTMQAGELDQAMRRADVVVAHAGTGIALSALQAGRRPVLVPRLATHGEHVDDHQHQTADALSARGLASTVAADGLTREHLLEAAAWRIEHAGLASATLDLG